MSADSTLSARTSTRPVPATPCPPNWPRGALPNDKNPQATVTNPAKPGWGREALGPSRGGLPAKIHLAADQRCRPLTRILTPGQHADCPQFIPLMNQVHIARRGKGRARTRPGRAMGDKAYSPAANRGVQSRPGQLRMLRETAADLGDER